MDAAAHMLETRGSVRFEGPPNEGLKELRAFVEGQNPSAVLLAEVDGRFHEVYVADDAARLRGNRCAPVCPLAGANPRPGGRSSVHGTGG